MVLASRDVLTQVKTVRRSDRLKINPIDTLTYINGGFLASQQTMTKNDTFPGLDGVNLNIKMGVNPVLTVSLFSQALRLIIRSFLVFSVSTVTLRVCFIAASEKMLLLRDLP